MSAKKKKKKKAAAKKPAKPAKKVAAKKPAAAAKKSAATAKKAAAPRRAAAKAPRPKKPSGPRVMHWEIQSQNPELLHSFYADVFGWKIDANNPMKYGMVTSGGGENAINGGIGGSPHPGSRVVVYANVPSIIDTLARIESLGGKTVMPRTDLGMVIIGIYTDPEGNTMGVIEG